MSEEKGLVESINEYLAKGKVELPVSNVTGLRLQQEISKPNTNFGDIEKLIVCDQALTAQVLKVANSAFYSGLQKVTSIRDAIIRLGTMEVSNIVTIVTQRQVFRGKDPFVCGLSEKLWQHSVACAVGAQWIAKSCNFRMLLNETFLGGLLHDIGKLFLLTGIEDIKLSGKLEYQLNNEMVNQALNDLHTEYGCLLLKNWNFPEFYCQVAQEHHAEKYDHHNDLLVIIRMANQACRKMGIGLEEDSAIMLPSITEANLLGLSEIAIAELQVKMEDSLLLAGQS